MPRVDPDHGVKMQVNCGSPHNDIMLPLTAAQLGIWFAQQIDPLSPAYNFGEYIEIKGSLDAVLFKEALKRVVRETEALRVRIVEREDGPWQVIGPTAECPVPMFDVSSERDARATAEVWMQSDLGRAIAPTRGPLFAYALFKASPDRFFWYARYHHIMMDGFGMALVARRVAEVYSQLSIGSSPNGSFAPLRALLDEEAEYRASEQFARDRRYWSDVLSDRVGPVCLGVRLGAPSHGFIRRSAYLARASVDRLRAIAQRTGTDLPQNHNGSRGHFASSIDRRGRFYGRLGRRRPHSNVTMHTGHALQRTAFTSGDSYRHDDG